MLIAAIAKKTFSVLVWSVCVVHAVFVVLHVLLLLAVCVRRGGVHKRLFTAGGVFLTFQVHHSSLLLSGGGESTKITY